MDRASCGGRRDFLQKATSNYAVDQSHLNIEQIIGKNERVGDGWCNENSRRREQSRMNVVQIDIDGTPSFLRHRKLPRNTLLTQSANSTSTSARHCDAQIPSLQETVKDWEKGTMVGIPFGNTWARWNKRSILHFNANEKVPRRKVPNPQGRLLAERNPKLDGVGKTKSSCG